MVGAREQVRPGVQRPHARDAFGDFGGFVEHFQLVIFRGQKIEPRIVARVGGDLFLQNLDVPVVLAAPRFAVRGKIVIDADGGFAQAAARGKNRGVDGFMHAAAVPIVRPVGKEPDDVIRGVARRNPMSDCAAPGNTRRSRREPPSASIAGAPARSRVSSASSIRIHRPLACAMARLRAAAKSTVVKSNGMVRAP